MGEFSDLTFPSRNRNDPTNRWERRKAKRDAKKRQMRVHGRNTATLYANAIGKRVK